MKILLQEYHSASFTCMVFVTIMGSLRPKNELRVPYHVEAVGARVVPLTIQWLTFIHIISNHQAGKSTACSSYSRLFLQLALTYVSDLVHSPCEQDGDIDEPLATAVEHEAFPFSRPP